MSDVWVTAGSQFDDIRVAGWRGRSGRHLRQAISYNTQFVCLHTDYLVRFLRASIALHQYERNTTDASGSMQTIGQDSLTDLPIPLLSGVAQKRISQYLQKVFSKNPTPERDVKAAIVRQQEYRSALTTNATVGKVDVRDFRIQNHGQGEV